MKKSCLAFLTVLLLMIFSFPALSASAEDVQIFDTGYSLSNEELSKASSRFQQVSDTINMHIVVILGSVPSSEAMIESLTESTFTQLYPEQADGICYYIDLSSSKEPYDYIYTSGMAQFYYTDGRQENRINSIFNAVDKYLYPKNRQDIPGALSEFADQLETYYQRGIPENYWIYDDVYHQYYYVENGEILTSSRKPYLDMVRLVTGALCGLLIGLLSALITNLSVRSKYQFMYELSPTTYLNKKSVRYIEQSDRFIRERINKVHTNPGGHGGEGSHSSSGGGGHSHGGHGGGGHHR